MNRKLSRLSRLAGCVSLVFAVLGGYASGLQAQTTLRFSTHVNEQDFRYQAWLEYKKLVEKGTQGRVKVDIFPSSTLHPFAKAIDALNGGVADIGTLAGAAIDDRMPCTQLTHFMPAYINTAKVYELHNSYNALMKDEFDKLALEILFSFDFGYDQEWFFRKPVKSLDQLDGTIVRSVGAITTHMIDAFGGKPVFVAPAETYKAAERGVVDGLNMGVATVTSWKLWEVMPYMIRSKMHYANIIYAAPKKKIASLSPADQKVVRTAGAEMLKWAEPRYEAWIQQQLGEAVMKYNVNIQNLSKAEIQRVVEKARVGWMPKIESACGPAKTRKLLDLFRSYGG
jgi:TRAP-type C4-dicarboxylate transport system substrate-binding protein